MARGIENPVVSTIEAEEKGPAPEKGYNRERERVYRCRVAPNISYRIITAFFQIILAMGHDMPNNIIVEVVQNQINKLNARYGWYCEYRKVRTAVQRRTMPPTTGVFLLKGGYHVERTNPRSNTRRGQKGSN